jgi:hypothetical protein
MPTINNIVQMQNLAIRIRRLWVEGVRDYELRTRGIASGWGNYEMPTWDGGINSKGQANECVWEKIAQFCIDQDMVPEVLVKAMFHDALYMPRPNQSHGDFARGRYAYYNSPLVQGQIKTNIKNAFESQQSYAAANTQRLKRSGGLTEEEALRSAVLAKVTPLSPLFKYCVLKNLGRPVAEDYAEVAYYQYRQFPKQYDEVWGDWIPQELRDRVQKGGDL